MKSVSLLLTAYILLLLVMFILPFYSESSYSIVSNTTSHLGAQHAPNNWIMNITFMLLGLSTIYTGWKLLHPFIFHKIVLTVFGFALFFAGVFQHASIIPTKPIDIQADNIHSFFASLTGFSFTLFAISSAYIQKLNQQKMLALGIGTAATLLSILMFTYPSFMGIFQRLIFISSFGWMIHFFIKWNKTTP